MIERLKDCRVPRSPYFVFGQLAAQVADVLHRLGHLRLQDGRVAQVGVLLVHGLHLLQGLAGAQARVRLCKNALTLKMRRRPQQRKRVTKALFVRVCVCMWPLANYASN